MPVPQIAIRLPPETKAAFETYAAGLGLDASELAKLLIVRERTLRRLAVLQREGEVPKRKRQTRGRAIDLPKITAHVSSLVQVKEFDDYAKKCELNRNSAGVWLLEKELSERWLEKSLSAHP